MLSFTCRKVVCFSLICISVVSSFKNDSINDDPDTFNDTVCEIKNFYSNNQTQNLVLESSNSMEEIWVKLGQNFKNFSLSVLASTKSSGNEFMFEKQLVVTKGDIFPAETNSSELSSWLLMVVNVITRKRTLMQDTLVLRVVVNRRHHDLDTQLWHRTHVIEKFYINVDGDLSMTQGMKCDPTKGHPLTGESKARSPDGNSNLAIVLPISLLVIVALVVLIALAIYFRRRKIGINEDLNGDYATLNPTMQFDKKSNTICSQPLPPIPSGKMSVPTYQRESTNENIYSSIAPNEINPLMATNALYTYDVPKSLDAKLAKAPKIENEENYYIEMKNLQE